MQAFCCRLVVFEVLLPYSFLVQNHLSLHACGVQVTGRFITTGILESEAGNQSKTAELCGANLPIAGPLPSGRI